MSLCPWWSPAPAFVYAWYRWELLVLGLLDLIVVAACMRALLSKTFNKRLVPAMVVALGIAMAIGGGLVQTGIACLSFLDPRDEFLGPYLLMAYESATLVAHLVLIPLAIASLVMLSKDHEAP